MMEAAEMLASDVGLQSACRVLGVSRAGVYRKRVGAKPLFPKDRSASARALNPAERQVVLDTLHSERFMDKAPQEVYATLLDRGKIYMFHQLHV
jgi:putative transposase